MTSIKVSANRRIVVASSYRQFRQYLDTTADPRIIHTFAQDAMVFVGQTFTPDQIIYLDGWTDHPRAKEIIAQIQLRSTLNARAK